MTCNEGAHTATCMNASNPLLCFLKRTHSLNYCSLLSASAKPTFNYFTINIRIIHFNRSHYQCLDYNVSKAMVFDLLTQKNILRGKQTQNVWQTLFVYWPWLNTGYWAYEQRHVYILVKRTMEILSIERFFHITNSVSLLNKAD